jgi:quinol monooxygenase YgiN
MPTIATNNDVIAVIILFSVEPERQQELIDTITSFLDEVKKQPGFVSASLHKSTDGMKVANYAQWRSQEDYEAFVNNSELQAKASKLSEFAKPDSHLYEVVISQSKVGTPKISAGGFLTHFAEFRMPPENQQRLLDLAKEEVVKAMENPGLISANFHRSLDGTRVINYGQWRSQEDIEALTKQPGFGKEDGYWRGLAENEYHLYEVVLTEPAE